MASSSVTPAAQDATTTQQKKSWEQFSPPIFSSSLGTWSLAHSGTRPQNHRYEKGSRTSSCVVADFSISYEVEISKCRRRALALHTRLLGSPLHHAAWRRKEMRPVCLKGHSHMTSANFWIYQQPPCRQYQNAASLPLAGIWATPPLQTSFVTPCLLHAMK